MKYSAVSVAILLFATHEAIGYRAHLKPSPRIIAGDVASEGQFPWQVAVGNPASLGPQVVCGGSLIHPEWVITAAHCVPGVTYFRLVFGAVDRSKMDDPGVVEVNSTEYIVHEGYNHTYLDDDLTLIKLPSPITLTDRINVVPLPKKGSRTEAGTYATVSGFGKTENTYSSDILHYVNLKTITNNKCARNYGTELIDSFKICAVGEGPQNACTGDSGGPLVAYDESGKATLIGIVDFTDSDGCAVGEASGYTRTEAHLDWITENTGVKFN